MATDRAGDRMRHDWTASELRALYELPLFDLVDRARAVHRRWHDDRVQLCTLVSLKTGGCPEDCAYCAQSSHFRTPVDPARMLDRDEVLAVARTALAAGASRLCMGAAWREVREGPAFEKVLDIVRAVKATGLETCCTLGRITEGQARRLREAGLDAYNHNLDTSREHYPSIVTTRTYDDRLRTLETVRRAGIALCCGGILGMGESVDDRCRLLATLAGFDPHPESVPVNALVPVPGTPLEKSPPVDPVDIARTIATARIAMPRSLVRLSAGRAALAREAQLLCLYAGANSIFYGDRLLTTSNSAMDDDRALLDAAGLRPMEPASAGGDRPAASARAEATSR